MYSDSHLHTSFSGDSDTPPEQQIERAVSLGMEHLTITDHHDMDFPPSFCSFELDLDHYIPEMQRLRETCRGRIDLGIGIELGLQPQLTRELPSCTSSWPFDFVIGSQHLVRRIDPYEMDQAIEALGTWDNVCRTYLEEELANLKQFDCWDIAGHLDYVVRYGRDRAGEYTWEKYGDVLDEILRTVIEKGKGIEYNTAGFKAGLGWGHPMPDAWKRYRELGGEILTIGSDAHVPQYVGDHFQEAGDFLKSVGFRYYCIYRNRKPVFLPL